METSLGVGTEASEKTDELAMTDGYFEIFNNVLFYVLWSQGDS